MAQQYQAQGLDEISRGLTRALEELGDVGGIGDAAAGRGFDELALSALDLGHDGLAAGFEMFCERWQWGVRELISEANQFAQGVGLNAGSYHEAEEYGMGALKIAANALGGNPHASEEEVTARGWDQFGWNELKPDWSAESRVEAAKDSMKTAEEIRDTASDSWMGDAYRTVSGDDSDGAGA